ncbi:MAG: tetratricopeptide repeat protein, partial [Deltaproteobacteria bacterium]
MSRKILLCICLFALPAAAFAGDIMFPEGAQSYNEGLKAQQSGNYEKALESYNRVMLLVGQEQNPFKKFILNNSAIIAVKRGDNDQALRLFNEALSIDPNYKSAAYNLGLLYYRMGDNASALKVWSRLFNFPGEYAVE